VTLGSEDYDSEVGFDGKKAVYIGINVAPAANLLDVIARVRNVFPDIHAQLPQGCRRDRLRFDQVREQRDRGSHLDARRSAHHCHPRRLRLSRIGASVLIPTVAIPLSLVGTFTVMFALGYSINLLTLLALVLAIGPRCRRRHHRRGERQPSSGGGHEAPAGGDPRGARARQSHHRDDGRAGRRVPSDHIPDRAHRGSFHGIRRHARRCGHRIGGGRADPVADDVRKAAETARPRASGWDAKLVVFLDRSFNALHRRYENFSTPRSAGCR